MKRSVLIFAILLLAISSQLKAQETNSEMKAFIERMDGANLEELEKELDEGIAGLKAFAGFFDGPGEEGIKNYTPDEERFEEPFKIDTSIVSKAIRQFENIGFQQIFRDDASFLKFQKIGDTYWNTVWMGEGMEEKFIPKSIFYKDGRRTSEGISKSEMSFFFEKPWGDMAIIDSVAIDYTINYTKAYDSVLLTKKSKKVNYQKGFVRVEKLEKNHLYLTVSDTYASGLYVRALNTDGKPLNQNSSSFSPTSDDNSEDGFEEILKILEEVQTKLKAKKFKDTEALKKHLLKKVSKLEAIKDKDGVYHKKYYFEGNIETVQVYLETEAKSKTVYFTAKNTSGFGDIILMRDKNENVFLNEHAKELFRLEYSPIESLGSRYFVNDTIFYHLNLNTKSLDLLKAIKVYETPNKLAFIQKEVNEGFILVNQENKQLSDVQFENVYDLDDTYANAISKDGMEYIIHKSGSLKKLENIKIQGNLANNRIIATKDGLYGFLDVTGEIIIPFSYKEAKHFKEGLALVKNQDNLYGFIDAEGVLVIPCIYEDANSFENGISFVENEDYLLIDKTGAILVRADTNGYSISGSGLQKTYSFGGKTYDAFGKLIPNLD